jgi:hypothetical protein
MGAITGTGQSDLATNHADCNIRTDNPNGYSLQWKASAAAMNDGNGHSIAAYTPALAGVPEMWSVVSTDSEWGGRLGKDSTTSDTSKWGTADTYVGGKWLNIGVSDTEVVRRYNETDAAGDNEYIWFGAEVGSNKLQNSGNYTVTVTMTAVAL